ncbi:MAG: tRNA (adenosine(37)-N6)-threonylcarbamoyltransferase complex transferase subunit TsaD [Chitinispirillales bacterium]|jgi:N6-L-threonylcarbamoyladenine synthase|nr:tRNA (adenosine(37)-N6)-threonylcarbamoyltransferase complex transferase subunit TsaD [Chitinispirillales bacterium]
MIVLGIESSCDETSAAIIKDGAVLSSLTHSQQEHSLYGGVVPEVASRAHLEKIDILTKRIIEECNLTAEQLDLIAVTDSPGLAGALLVGVSFALGLHTAYGIPVTGVNHLEGHICSLFIEYPNIPAPFLCLLASGGHTAIYRYESYGNCRCLGRTVDDAAGEAFDKVGKLLGFPYPAGRAIEDEAAKADESDKTESIKFPTARFSSPESLDFSFSGLKTAVKNFISSNSVEYIKENRPQICAAFQRAVSDSLVNNLRRASESCGIKTAALSGGVACNGYLKKELIKKFGAANVFFPPPQFCTDNGAMIAMAGLKMYNASKTRFPNMDPARGIEEVDRW